MKYLLLLTVLVTSLFSLDHYPLHAKEHLSNDQITIHDTVILTPGDIDGEAFFGISALSYDANRDILYLLGDRGRLFTFRIVLKAHTISSVQPIRGYRLKDVNGKKLLKPYSDSEGMAMLSEKDKKVFYISFEQHVRIEKYDIQGRGLMPNPLEKLKLPKLLQDARHFQDTNGALEGLTYHEKYGYLAAAEYPIKGQKAGYHGIYNPDGEVCRFQKTSSDNAVTGLETMPDGNLIVLQRAFSFKDFSTVITLKKVSLETIENGICEAKDLIRMESDKGWNLDNFEGITHYKDNLYLMISDDNGNPFQKTLLTLFEVQVPKQE